MSQPWASDPGQHPPHDGAGRPEVDALWRDPGGGRPQRRRPPPPRRSPLRWGSLPGGYGIAVVIGAAVLGALATVLAGSEPGPLLDVLLIAGTAAATLAVAPRSAYLIIPVPALAYVVAAIAAGLVHDRATDTSRTALTVSAVQWIASGFLAMTAATVLAIAIAAARRLRSSHGPRRPWPP